MLSVLLALFLCTALVNAHSDDDDDGHQFSFLSHKHLREKMAKQANMLGVGYVEVCSRLSFAETEKKLVAAIEASPLTLMATIDHQRAAMSRDLPIQPAKVFVFGNPNIGTKLMQKSPSYSLGIDLPQKMLLFEEGEMVYVAYNAPNYLAQRHGLVVTDSMTELQTVARVLGQLAAAATHTEPKPVFSKGKVEHGAGLKYVVSEQTADIVFDQLTIALNAAEPVNVPLQLRHDNSEIAMQRHLSFAGLAVFGNPSLGTYLIRANPRLALDLPMRALVVQNDTTAITYYNDIDFLLARFNIYVKPGSRLEEIVSTLRCAVDDFVNAAQH